MGKDSAARIELGRSFHQMGTVNEKVCESDFANWFSAFTLQSFFSQKNYLNLFQCTYVFCKMHFKL